MEAETPLTISRLTFHAFQIQRFTVAVFACFLILWTPHHVQRIIYIVITKLEISWTRNLIDIQETMHLIAGNIYYSKYIHLILLKFECVNKDMNFILIYIMRIVHASMESNLAIVGVENVKNKINVEFIFMSC